MNINTLHNLTDKYGCPLYVYDAEKIINQFQNFKNAFQVDHFGLNYAVKALSNISVLKIFKSLGAHIDCVSIQEVELGFIAGFSNNEISFTPSGISYNEIEAAIKLGVKINIDNLSMLKFLGENYPEVPVCIRINPSIKAGGNDKISVGHKRSKFGILVEQIHLVKEIEKKHNMLINGVHMHTGSDILDVSVFLKAAEVLFEVAEKFENLDFIDFGGGFKVAYHHKDESTNIEEFGKLISKRFNHFCDKYGKSLKLVFEPGKYMVSEAGQFLVKVNVVKKTPEVTFVGVDSGFNHLIRPMYYNAYHHISNISNPNGQQEKYNVVGYICETDTFAQDRLLNEVREGDILSFSNAGAYAFTMASNYNSRFKPPEVMIYKNKDYLIRERETLNDITKNQVIIELNLD